jgi:hypothetical protein
VKDAAYLQPIFRNLTIAQQHSAQITFAEFHQIRMTNLQITNKTLCVPLNKACPHCVILQEKQDHAINSYRHFRKRILYKSGQKY